MAAIETVAPADRSEAERDDGAGACHLSVVYDVPMCGAGGVSGDPSDFARPREGINCLGPVCDGPDGCGRQRCPECAVAWLAQHVTEGHDA
jgi:hypothetical protein